MIEIGQKVPAWQALGSQQNTMRSSDYAGQRLVLYFYPKDHTPGCTRESQEFRDRHAEFSAHNCQILGVSRDGFASHQRFMTKHELPFELLVDQDETLCTLFDVVHAKTLFGKVSLGIVRSTFLIDGDGVLRHAWRKVKVPGHVDQVLAAAATLAEE